MTMKRRHLCMFQNLPEEIISDIFSRLSIKELFQCQLVCKDWYTNLTNLVSNPFFVSLHHSRINQDQDGSNFIIQCSTSENLSKLYLIDSENHSSTATLKPTFDINLNLPSMKLMVVGSSNGLLCLCSVPDHETYYICNPLTREVLQLPRACGLDMYRKQKLPNCFPTSSGFAFDTITNTYKVVRTWYFTDHIGALLKTGVEIYTLGSGKWRRVEDIRRLFHFPEETSQVFVNGALHWYISWCDIPYHIMDKTIGAIDINCENYRKLEGPPCDFITHKRTLGVLKESLCVIDDIVGEIVVWIMKDSGITKSWTREYIVQKTVLRPLRGEPYKILTTTVKKQSVFFHSDLDQGFYDLEKEELVHVRIKGKPEYFDKFEAIFHLGSLISPRTIDTTSAETIKQVSYLGSNK